VFEWHQMPQHFPCKASRIGGSSATVPPSWHPFNRSWEPVWGWRRRGSLSSRVILTVFWYISLDDLVQNRTSSTGPESPISTIVSLPLPASGEGGYSVLGLVMVRSKKWTLNWVVDAPSLSSNSRVTTFTQKVCPSGICKEFRHLYAPGIGMLPVQAFRSDNHVPDYVWVATPGLSKSKTNKPTD